MNELMARLEQYEKMFGESFPTYPLMVSRTEDEVLTIVNKCIEARKDVYELGYLKDDSNIKY